MKLGPVTKLDNRNITMIKEFSDDMSFQQIERPLSFFKLMTNIQPSKSRILGVWLIKLKFSLTTMFYLTKPDNQTIKSLTIAIALSEGYYICQKDPNIKRSKSFKCLT